MIRLNLGPKYEKNEPENDFLAMRREIDELSDYNESFNSTEEDSDSKLFSNKKSKKKKKKKKEKFIEDKIDMLLGDSDLDNDDDILLGDDILSVKKPKKGKIDLFDMKAAKKKKKKNIEAKFAPQITHLRKVLRDVELTTEDAIAIFKKMKDSSRYVGKNLVDLISAINSSNNTRASIIREISNINKAIIDLQLKETRNKKDDPNNGKGAEEFGSEFFARLFSGPNRKDLKRQAKDFYNNQDFDDEFDDDEESDYINSRITDEGNRSADGDKYIEYEQLNPEDCILYHSNGTWETAAIDKTGALMDDDYPVIPKENLGDVRFNLEDRKATDATGRVFKVIEVD